MKTLFSSKAVLIISVAFLSLSAEAALIDNGTYISDTDSHLDWLKVEPTRGLGFNGVSAQMGVGQAFYGWSYATGAQFDVLMLGQGAIPDSGPCYWGGAFCGNSPANVAAATYVSNLLGETRSATITFGPSKTEGFLADIPPGGANIVRFTASLTGSYGEIDTYYSTTDQRYDVASFLVRPSAVPVPGSLWLLSSGLLGLIGIGRRKTS